MQGEKWRQVEKGKRRVLRQSPRSAQVSLSRIQPQARHGDLRHCGGDAKDESLRRGHRSSRLHRRRSGAFLELVDETSHSNQPEGPPTIQPAKTTANARDRRQVSSNHIG
jgi:hypothetical protein